MIEVLELLLITEYGMLVYYIYKIVLVNKVVIMDMINDNAFNNSE